MGFYVRKSVKAGPFRFNLSKSGVGVSVGVPGFRVGTGPRGNYVHIGRNGVYYRASLNGHDQRSFVGPRQPIQDHHLAYRPSDIVMEDVTGATAMTLEPTGRGDVEGDPFDGPVAMRLAVGGSWSTVGRTRLG
ncbi:DUF4236 domain-containing protein [Mycobacterium bourgelatii]|uniref:DUF4236 domain-containing protein n=1 Tax=Mycobacterium bourgelatii TaxID=1273442 RepID=A0A7I9YRU3_MYCBU|nr:hypothetical protein MBOU_34280 [Mycobacterium bourgelatii]